MTRFFCPIIFRTDFAQVLKSDRMPQRICMLCVDKINDFYEYRQMCAATNVQTRKLLDLPPEQPKKSVKKLNTKSAGESIFGIVGDEIKIKAEAGGKTTKKSKKSTGPTPSFDERRLRGLTQDDIEMAYKLEQEANEDKFALGIDVGKAKSKKSKKGKETAKSKANATLLLAPKELNQRERKREIEQKKIDKYVLSTWNAPVSGLFNVFTLFIGNENQKRRRRRCRQNA